MACIDRSNMILVTAGDRKNSYVCIRTYQCQWYGNWLFGTGEESQRVAALGLVLYGTEMMTP